MPSELEPLKCRVGGFSIGTHTAGAGGRSVPAPDAVLAQNRSVTMGVTRDIMTCARDRIVSGSAVFKADNPASVFAQMAKN